METTVDTNGCTFLWNIENLSRWNWLEKNERITSPVFVANALEKTKWTLWLYTKEEKKVNNVKETFFGIYLHREKDCEGPDEIKIDFDFQILHKTGSEFILKDKLNFNFKKGGDYGYNDLKKHETVFNSERYIYLIEDTLTVRCTLWQTDEKPIRSNYLVATTVINVKWRCFLWRIDKLLDIESDIQNKFEDYLISIGLYLPKDLTKISVKMVRINDGVKYMSLDVSIIDSEEKREYCNKFKYCFDSLKKKRPSFTYLLSSKRLIENKNRYFPNDVLSFRLEFVFLTCENSDCKKYSDALENLVGKRTIKLEDRIPNRDHLLNELIDTRSVKLCIGTEIIKAHWFVLSDVSIWFESLFNSGMEKNKPRSVEITDFDYDTVKRMVKYIYSGELNEDDRNYEIVRELYKISVYFKIPSLKSICSSILERFLDKTNACFILHLADSSIDGNLKAAAQIYIMEQRKQFFFSEEWENCMKDHLEIAADVMYRKIIDGKL